MVMQRFLTHFKPWLIAVAKAGALIVVYQVLDQIRARLQHPPLNTADVLMVATVALAALALLCAVWAWGEWCCFRLRQFRRFGTRLRLAFGDRRKLGTVRTWQA
jgi:hypothetical protein